MDCYTTIQAQARDEFVEKRSRFIGTIAPVRTEEEAVAFVAQVRACYKDASHNVYAYSLRQGQQKRFSDDGEPQGTAGKPVLEVLLRQELVDVAVVVTRYFGGVLLGAGGLLRAYTQGAKAAVDAAAILQMHPAVRVELDLSYDFYGKLTYILPDFGILTEDSQFGEGIRMQLLMKQAARESFAKKLQELSGGVVSLLEIERLWHHFD